MDTCAQQCTQLWSIGHNGARLPTTVHYCARVSRPVHAALCICVETLHNSTYYCTAVCNFACILCTRRAHNRAQLCTIVRNCVHSCADFSTAINFSIFSYDSAYQCARMADSSLPMNNSSRLLRSSSSSLPRNTSSSLPRSSSSALPGHLPTAAASCRISQRRLALIISPFQTCGSHKRRKKGSVTHRPVTWA